MGIAYQAIETCQNKKGDTKKTKTHIERGGSRSSGTEEKREKTDLVVQITSSPMKDPHS